MCKQNHNTFQCDQFFKLDRHARSAKIKSLTLCYNCLRSNHMANDCKSGTCRKCKHKHHTLLYFESELVTQAASSSGTINFNSSTNFQAIVTSKVLLSIASTLMANNCGKPVKCKVLLDNGSQSNFVTEKLCNILKLPKKEVNVPVGF